MNVTIKNLTDQYAENHKVSKKEAHDTIENVLNLLGDNLKQGNIINLRGYFKMHVQMRDARKGTNPATGEPIIIPSRRAISFTASKDWKEAVNGIDKK